MTAQDLKNSILQQAIQGKLVPQNPADEPASELLKKISAERQKLIEEGKIKNAPSLPPIKDDEKPFNIPNSWQWVRLGEIGKIVGGGTPKTENPKNWSPPKIAWITPADIRVYKKDKYISNGARYISEYGLKNSSAQLMPKGTVLFSSRAPIGHVAIAENEICTNQGFKSIVPFEMQISEFIYY